MWEYDHEEGWMSKNWCFQTVGLGETLESRLNSKKIKPVNPKGSQAWLFTGRTDAEAPILWPPDMKSRLFWKRPWCWERLRAGGEEGDKGWDGWSHHWFNGHESKQTPGDSRGQRSLECCSSRSRKESDLNEWLNNNPNDHIKQKMKRHCCLSAVGAHCAPYYSESMIIISSLNVIGSVSGSPSLAWGRVTWKPC